MIGSVCVWDEQPRELTADQRAQLVDIADLALALVDRHRAAQEATALADRAEEARRAAEEAHAALNRAQAFDRALFARSPSA